MTRIPLIVRDQSLNFVVSKSGMGNRIMPAGCALSLAKELNYRLVMFWPKSPETGWVRFDDLFGLASTSRLIGTWPSTFLVLAAMIGNKPMIRIHLKDFVYMKFGMI